MKARGKLAIVNGVIDEVCASVGMHHVMFTAWSRLSDAPGCVLSPTTMHPRSPYRTPPDFNSLANGFPKLRP